MNDLEIQKYIEDNCRNIEGGEMMDEQAFYEGAKWYRDNVVNKLPIQQVEVSSLKTIAVYLEGVKQGKGGNLLPLGNNDLEQLWNTISLLQEDERLTK